MDVIGLADRPGAYDGALMESGEDLIARARRGDEEAFRFIFERYTRPVMRFIFCMVSDRSLAEELAQETFMRALATATNSHVRFSGTIRADGRYFLKSMSGAVEMEAPVNSPGFTATLSSYRGGIETDFPLKTNKSSTKASASPVNHRLIGRYGNGQAQITLDSFDGKVRLSKMASGALKNCK